jgi:hypothetical protein
MKIFVEAKPKAREEKVEKIGESHYKVWVKEPPVDGKANMAVMKALIKYFDIKWVDITLVSGFSSRTKVFEINK